MTEITVPFPNGEIVAGTEIQIKKSTESWSEFELADGTLIRAKITLASVAKLNKLDDHGKPIYGVNATPIIAFVTTSQPSKKKPKKSQKKKVGK